MKISYFNTSCNMTKGKLMVKLKLKPFNSLRLIPDLSIGKAYPPVRSISPNMETPIFGAAYLVVTSVPAKK